MSRTPFGKPEFRLAMDYPHITVTRSDARAGESSGPDAPMRAYDLASPTLVADLRRLGAEIRRARGRLTVVLPEGEVWRGRLALGEAAPRERGNIVKSQAAQAMGLPMAALAVRLGRLDRDGTLPAAAVRRETLSETRAFLARAGLKPARITGGGDFEGFARAPQLDTPPLVERLRPIAPAAGGALAAAALVALLIRPGHAPDPEVAMVGPMPLAVVQPEALSDAAPVAVAELSPRRRPTDLVIVRAPATAPPTTITMPAVDREVFRRGPVTMATRSVALDDLPPVRRAEAPGLRLSELNVARARMADALSGLAQLRPGGAPSGDTPGGLAAMRDLLAGTTDAPILSGASSVAPARPEAAPIAAAPAETPVPAATPVAAPKPAATPEAAPVAAAPAISAPRPPQRPAALAPQAAAPKPAPAASPAPVVETAEAETPGPAPAAPTTVAAAPSIAPPPSRPESGAAGQVAQAVGAAVVAAGIEAKARTPEVAAPAASAATSVASAAASALRPAPRADFRPVRQAAVTPTVHRPSTTPKRAAAAPAPQPARAATQATARTAAPAPQRVVTAPPTKRFVSAPQPARQAAPAPQPARQPAAAPQPTRQAAAAPQRAPAAQRPTTNATTSATAAAAATQNVNLSRRGVTLIGVFGPESSRYAMVRLSNGSVQRVKTGDDVQGARVAAVGQSSVQFANGGRTTTLAMP